jgi:nodulation protein E
MNRVVITGLGVVSPVGNTLDKFWSALVDGKAGIGPITIIPTEGLNARVAAQVLEFDPMAHFDPKRVGLLDRFSQFAVVAARAALSDAELTVDEELALEAATVLGTGIGGQTTMDEQYSRIYLQKNSRVHPFTVPKLMPNAAASQVSMDLGLKGPTYSVVSACASSTHAIGQAFHMVRSGQAPFALAGGTEACLTFGTIKGWEALRVLAPDTCRPFCKTRLGLVLAEGAAIMVLEPRDRAIARGARIYAEILGFGMSADAADITAPDADGAARAMNAALKDAKAVPADIDYINAHGTGTTANDRTETIAIRKVFGTHADKVAVTSSKSVLGHSLGAAGALELAATALAIRNETIPPTANFQEADPECDLDVVPNAARKATIRMAMSNSFAFGGLNAVLVVGRA